MQELRERQCDVGTVVWSASTLRALRYADAGRLYVDFGQPAQCTGEMIRWELCYTVIQSTPGPSTSVVRDTITAVVLRRDAKFRTYRIINVYDINIDGADERTTERNSMACHFIDSEDGVFIERGDFLGFVCGERVRILLTSLLQGQVSRDSKIRVFNTTPVQQDTAEIGSGSYLQGISFIQEDQFESIYGSMTPLLRVIISKRLIQCNFALIIILS